MQEQDNKQATARLDSIVESDVARGFRVCEVPERVQEVLKANGFKVMPKVKFLAMNATRRRDINEAVQIRYFKDLRDDNILSNAQIRELVEKRGEWSRADDERLEELNQRVQQEMLDLWRDGYKDDGEAWRREMLSESARLRTIVDGTSWTPDEKARYHSVYQRWAAWLPEQQLQYDADYAKEQGLDVYRPDRDQNELLTNAPNEDVADIIATVDDLRDKQRRLTKLVVMMSELQVLKTRHARIFSGSAESRQNAAEELAQIYFACEALAEDERPVGKLADTFDTFYSWPHEAVKWFIYEAYFFHNDIPQVAARQYLETYGFLKADPAIEQSPGESAPSDASPVPQTSSDDSALVTETPLSSSAAA